MMPRVPSLLSLTRCTLSPPLALSLELIRAQPSSPMPFATATVLPSPRRCAKTPRLVPLFLHTKMEGAGSPSVASRRWPGAARGRQAAACLLWQEEEDNRVPLVGWAGFAQLGCYSGGLAGLPGKFSLSLWFSILISVFYYSVIFRAFLKIPRHFQNSPNCTCPLFRTYPTWNISVWDYLDI